MSHVCEVNSLMKSREESLTGNASRAAVERNESYNTNKRKVRMIKNHLKRNPSDIFLHNFRDPNAQRKLSQCICKQETSQSNSITTTKNKSPLQLSDEGNVKRMKMWTCDEECTISSTSRGNKNDGRPTYRPLNDHFVGREAFVSRIGNSDDDQDGMHVETHFENIERNSSNNDCIQCDSSTKNHLNSIDSSQIDDNYEEDNEVSSDNSSDESSVSLNDYSDNNDIDDDDGQEDANVPFAIDAQNDKMTFIMTLKNNITAMALVLIILAVSVRSKFTYTTIILMFKVFNAICEIPKLPATVRSLWKMLTRNDDLTTARHYYCQFCYNYVGVRKYPPQKCTQIDCASIRNKKKSLMTYFIQLSIKSQLEQLFSNSGVVSCLDYRFTRDKQNENNVEDIYDGTKYRKLCVPGGFLDNKYNFTFGLFTDGCKVSNSSNASAWPIMLTINELSPRARKKYMILAGIWVDKKHPDLQRIILPIVHELKSLYENGMSWYHPIEKRTITSQFLTVVCTLDSAARPHFLKMTLFNGFYGCTYCYHKGESTSKEKRGDGRNSRKSLFVYPHETPLSRCRTDKEMRKDMEEASRSGESVRGCKGIPAIACLNNFDLSCGIPVDSMHNVYLGVVRFHFEYCLQVTSKWYVGNPNNKRTINNMLMEIYPPSRISRKPQLLEEWRQWKASQWRNWIEWYALPLLDGIISENHHKHLRLLCRAVYSLNKSSIDTNEIAEARSLLQKYVEDFQKLYGKRMMRYNVHLLTHLADSVQFWGPFWTHSAFPYESYNKKIVEKVTSANARPLQIATRFLLERFVENSLHNEAIPQETKKLIYSSLTNELRTKIRIPSNAYQPVPLNFKFFKRLFGREITNKQLQALSRVGYNTPREITRYQRVTINGTHKFAVKEEKGHVPRYCDQYIYCDTIGGYGEIVEIVEFHHNNDIDDNCDTMTVINGLFVNLLSICGNAYDTSHIQYVNKSDEIVFLAINDKKILATIIPAIVIRTRSQGQLIISKVSNMWECD